ncbi:spore germination protein [Alteribacillus bidgolensis]|uniref:Spore germination protein KA n=1 Tax=Alteribacillus bidgolensis TaxID=930129 RepID=A0A1G8FZU1_9BACI|nr:spore germination protein [Alteribacillus bidgolensis]SDH87659.1 spore germination protein KA [Alteribacillus bidgolensis]
MIRKLNKILKTSKPKKNKSKNEQLLGNSSQPSNNQTPISKNIDENEKFLRSLYENSFDVVFREFSIARKEKALLIYIDGMSNLEEIDKHILSPLMKESIDKDYESLSVLVKNVLSVSEVEEINSFKRLTQALSYGKPIVLIEGFDHAVAFGLQKWDQRGIEEPISEAVVQGPREGFNEVLKTNATMLRRRIRSPQFKMKTKQIGRYTATEIAICYVEGLAEPTLLEEVENRLERIDIDGILESTYLEEMIEDDPTSPFPQMLRTERPDAAAANLLEGRVVLIIDGTPLVIIVPSTLFALMQSGDDYYNRYMAGTAIRWLRFVFLLIALMFPALYVALMTYHQEMIPSALLFSIAASREEVPFPVLVEVLLMEFTFEALREAGLRLPKQIGSAVSIVGALVIGEAAVTAGIVSAPMVIVVAVTGIASFTIPRYTASVSIRLLRFPLIFLASFLGLLGIMLGLIMLGTHLCTLRSFGVPYLSPVAPLNGSQLKDVIIRAPWYKLNKRPHFTGGYNKYRQAPGQKPGPKKRNGR